MRKSSPSTVKSSVAILAPVFLLLSACGGDAGSGSGAALAAPASTLSASSTGSSATSTSTVNAPSAATAASFAGAGLASSTAPTSTSSNQLADMRFAVRPLDYVPDVAPEDKEAGTVAAPVLGSDVPSNSSGAAPAGASGTLAPGQQAAPNSAPEERLLAEVVSSTTYTTCAIEGAVCSFTGTKVIRYGASGKYVSKTLSAAVPCTNATFGDPYPGVKKTCDYVSAPPASTAPSSRDVLKQPFASNSIWNMPIGSGAVYVAANLSGNPGNNIWAGMPGIDDEKIILRPTSPMTAINTSSAAWTGRNRCSATGGLLVSVPMPSDYIVPNNAENSSAAFLLSDRRTVVQTQPLARCTARGAGTALVKMANVDLYGPGITGAHGGSGLSAIGGSIRVGELRPTSATGPRHALKVNVYAKEALFKCTTRAACFRWPATTSDSYSVGFYGSASNNQNSAMKMGALLAIPASKDIASLGLETQPAKQLAWTLQNYGAYVVDDTYAPGFAFNTEEGPDGSMRTQFKSDWGFELEQKVQGNTAWVRDIQKIVKALYVVNNNSATSIGGGGNPRQPLAAAVAP